MSAANQDIQATIQEVRNRLKTDEAFRRRAAEDLPGVLRTAGLPEEAIARFSVSQESADGEVSGYVSKTMICYSEGDKQECWDPAIKNW